MARQEGSPPRGESASSGAASTVKVTPMLGQYLSVKAQVPDAILFFRLGDFFEMFFEDAECAARVLDLTLTSRNKDDPNPIPMCGVPAHAVRGYLARLVSAGFKVAVCDQLGDPSSTPGLIERGLTRVVTPGTVLDEEEGLDQRLPGHLASLGPALPGGAIALAVAEVSTGTVRCCIAPSETAALDELGRLDARELVVDAADATLGALAERSRAALTRRETDARDAATAEEVKAWVERALTRLSAGALSADETAALRACLARLVGYVADTVRGGLQHLASAQLYRLGDHLMLDERSRRNLDLVECGGARHGSLWWAVDGSATAMGSRTIREWLLQPLVEVAAIGARQDAIEVLVEAPGLRAELATDLRGIGDLERLVGRLGLGRGGPRELLRLGRSLERAAAISASLTGELPTLLAGLRDAIAPPAGLAQTLLAQLADPAPLTIGEGGALREGVDAELDRLRATSRDAHQLLADLEAREREATGIGSLKIRHHRAFGYFFEVTKANLGAVPAHFRRRQSIASGERHSSDELEDLERRISSAGGQALERELQLFTTLIDSVAAHHGELVVLARALAQLDALVGLATVAHERGYSRPLVDAGRRIRIRDGRHPVVERTSAAGRFVPNDVELDDTSCQLVVLTGPNMAGKSTYLRQTALLVLLAQVGSFVPAARAEIGVIDRIWTRVGAADDLVAGDSTFMVEMKETAAILSGLTPRTLVVLDEIGRGTSTYDGIAIAWSVAEHLHDTEPAPGARVKTLFATHFHELTALAETRARVRNFSVAVREWKDDVLFLRKVVAGAASRSFGIAVARLAGVPEPVVRRARDLLRGLEAGTSPTGTPLVAGARTGRSGPRDQLDLFATNPGSNADDDALTDDRTIDARSAAGGRSRRPSRGAGPNAAAPGAPGAASDEGAALIEALSTTEIDHLTPLEALRRLHELVEMVRAR